MRRFRTYLPSSTAGIASTVSGEGSTGAAATGGRPGSGIAPGYRPSVRVTLYSFPNCFASVRTRVVAGERWAESRECAPPYMRSPSASSLGLPCTLLLLDGDQRPAFRDTYVVWNGDRDDSDPRLPIPPIGQSSGKSCASCSCRSCSASSPSWATAFSTSTTPPLISVIVANVRRRFIYFELVRNTYEAFTIAAFVVLCVLSLRRWVSQVLTGTPGCSCTSRPHRRSSAR